MLNKLFHVCPTFEEAESHLVQHKSNIRVKRKSIRRNKKLHRLRLASFSSLMAPHLATGKHYFTAWRAEKESSLSPIPLGLNERSFRFEAVIK